MAQKDDSNRALIVSALSDLRGFLTGTSTEVVDRFASAGADRARRLEAAGARMAEALGADHPRAVRMRRRAEVISAVAARTKDSKHRIDASNALRPHEWLAHGRIVRNDGTPLEGLRVRVFDRDGQDAELLGDEITDEVGEFRAVYHVGDFGDEEERSPDLFVTISDGSGKILFVSDRAVKPDDGRTVFFQIMLSADRLEKGQPRTRCAAQTAKGAQCKNLAIPGGTYCALHQSAEGATAV